MLLRGVLSTSGCPDGVKGLGSTILGLELTSFAILVLITMSITITLFCFDELDNDSECLKFSICIWFSIFVAGTTGVSGCVTVFDQFGDYEKCWALYVSICTSTFLIFVALAPTARKNRR
uniref:Uncharacterized protein LOC111101353 isoform X2 n=1 Tax=Crassostrea virginica TaxID=6565 RepID=A0A8B8ADG3_CRAVI|nr:uncharacterized protein LOC111101353 isoform X2 [Crassostrea virginica]